MFIFKTGDRVGVMRKPDNSLHFFLNGRDIGNCFTAVPNVLYGVVDIYGKAEQVTITGMYRSVLTVVRVLVVPLACHQLSLSVFLPVSLSVVLLFSQSLQSYPCSS
jgi:hypothetical protein